MISGRYRILSELGKGGFGTVYRAHQLSIGRDVALKCMAPELVRDPRNVERFRREALHISQLCHPNTVTLYDYGQTEDELLYIVLELVEGRSLGKEITDKAGLGSERGGHVFTQVCRSLAEAHQHGIVHRDLKPDNILLCEMHGDVDYVKVLDFGLAKAMTWSDAVGGRLTAEGKVFGTPMYMAPEQVCGEDVTPATDVYALGLLFFETVTGLLPVEGKTRLKVMRAQLNDPVPQLPPELSRHGFGDVIAVCTRKDPKARYPNAGALLEAVLAARHSGEPIVVGFAGQVGPVTERSTQPTRQVRREAAPDRRPEGAEGGSSSPRTGAPLPAAGGGPGDDEIPLNRDAFSREPELAALQRWLRELNAGTAPRLATCFGEPGAGKSRLIERWQIWGAAGVGTVPITMGMSSCRPSPRHPLEPVREAILQALPRSFVSRWRGSAQSGDAGEEVESFLFGQRMEAAEPTTAEAAEAAQRPSRLVAGLGRLLEAFGRVTPTVLILDDAEHMSFATCLFVEHVAMAPRVEGASGTIGIALVGRSDVVVGNPDAKALLSRMTGPQVREVPLERLSQERCDAFVDALLPTSDELKSRVYALSDGNPLYVLQIMRFLHSSGALVRLGELYDVRTEGQEGASWVPDDVLDLLGRRIEDAVSRHAEIPGLKTLLQWLALLGQRVPLALLELALGHAAGSEGATRVRSELAVLSGEGLVRLDGPTATVQFDHVLVREALLREVEHMKSASRWHRRAAEAKLDYAQATGDTAPYREIATHFERAGEVNAYRRHLLRAGRQARAAMERRRARESYVELLRSLSRDASADVMLELEAWSALGELSESLGELGPAEDYYRLVTEQARTRGLLHEQIVAHRGRARVLLLQHRLGSARPLVEASCELARDLRDMTQLVQSLVVLSEVASRSGDLQSCVLAAREIEAHLDSVTEPTVLGRTLLHLGELARRSGETELAVSHQQEALEHFEVVGDVQGISDALCELGFHAVERRDNAVAEAYLARALDLKEGIADQRGIGQVLNHLGLHALSRGDFERAEHYLRRSLAIFRAMGAAYSVANGLSNLGLVLSFNRRYEEADATFQEGLDSLQAVGDRLMSSICLTHRAILAINRGQREAARGMFREARRLKDEVGSSWGMAELMWNLALVASWDGELSASARMLRHVLDSRLEVTPAEAAAVSSLLGLLQVCSGDRAGVEALQRGHALAAGVHEPQVLALCVANLGVGLCVLGRVEEGERWLDQLTPGALVGTLEPSVYLEWLAAVGESTEMDLPMEKVRQATLAG